MNRIHIAVIVCSLLLLGNLFVTYTRATETNTQCVQPAQGPVGSSGETAQVTQTQTQQTQQVLAKVGKGAPDFEATAFINGEFKNVKLSDYKGKWVVLCFYPGDFTFV